MQMYVLHGIRSTGSRGLFAAIFEPAIIEFFAENDEEAKRKVQENYSHIINSRLFRQIS